MKEGELMILTKRLLSILLLLGLAACQSYEFTSYQQTDKPFTYEDVMNKQEHEHLLIWTHDDIAENTIEHFIYSHPNIRIDVEVVDRTLLVDTYQQSIIKGDGPDLFIIPHEDLGAFSGIDGLENLLEAPYYDQAFFDSRPSGLLKNHVNASGQMYAFPILFFPYLTYYRADVLEKAGFPSEPSPVSEFLSDVDNWMLMAKQLKKNDQYIVESPNSLLHTALRSSNFLSDDFNYLGEKGAFSKMIDVAIKANEQELHANLNIWDPLGLQALQEERLVMFYMASYGQEILQDWVPEQKGKWRVTALPFELTGINRAASVSIAVSSESKNKQLAWTFAQALADDMITMYTNPNEDPFYNQGDLNTLYWDLMMREQPGTPSMLDQSIRQIWQSAMYQFTNGVSMNNKAMDNVHRDIENRIRYDQRVLQDNQFIR